MPEPASDDLARVIRHLRRSQRRLLILALAAWVGTGAFVFSSASRLAAIPIAADGVLTVRGVIVVDGNGVERIRLGAPLPDPLILGRRLKRKGAVSGVMVSDADGTERSGYGTGDDYGNVLFTLDSTGDQQVLFMVDPSGPAQLSLFDDEHHHAIRLAVSPQGPHLKIVSDGEAVMNQPAARASR